MYSPFRLSNLALRGIHTSLGDRIGSNHLLIPLKCDGIGKVLYKIGDKRLYERVIWIKEGLYPQIFF